MFVLLRRAFQSLFILIFFTGCTDGCRCDGVLKEPQATLYLNDSLKSTVIRVYGIGGQGDIPPASRGGMNAPAYDYLLPISMRSDTTTYVIVSQGRTDTISVGYRRVFIYEGTDCGTTIQIDDFDTIQPTTLDQSEFGISPYED